MKHGTLFGFLQFEGSDTRGISKPPKPSTFGTSLEHGVIRLNSRSATSKEMSERGKRKTSSLHRGMLDIYRSPTVNPSRMLLPRRQHGGTSALHRKSKVISTEPLLNVRNILKIFTKTTGKASFPSGQAALDAVPRAALGLPYASLRAVRQPCGQSSNGFLLGFVARVTTPRAVAY